MSEVTGQGALTFGSEEERIAAIEALGETQEDLEALERIRAAEIVAQDGAGAEPVAAGQMGADTQEPSVALPAADVPDTAAAAPTVPAGPITLNPEELRAKGFTYTTPEHILKGLEEKEDLIRRQQAFIKEKLKSGDSDEIVALRRQIEELKAAVGANTQSAPTQTAVAQKPAPAAASAAGGGSIESALAALERIDDELAAVEKQIGECDPYELAASGLIARQAELQRAQNKAMRDVAAGSLQTREEITRHTQAVQAAEAERVRRQQMAEAEEQNRQRRIADFAEMDAVGADAELAAEFRMSKPAVEVEKDFLQWQADVAMAFYNQPARTRDEVNYALNQLQIKNPELVERCRLMGVPVDPSPDVLKLLSLYEAMDYRDGQRPDPGNPGQSTRHTRYDPVTRQMVPIMMTDLKAAIKQRRLEGGHYGREIDQAYQRGGAHVASAMTRRDSTVTELNSPSTMGTSGSSGAEWAANFLQSVDGAEVRLAASRGDMAMLNEVNRALATLGMEPMEINS